MRIDYQGWYRAARNHNLIDKSLLDHGEITTRYLYENAIGYEQVGENRFRLVFKAPLGYNFSEYKFTIEMDINELLPFIRPLLAKKSLSELGSRYGATDFNNSSYLHLRRGNKYSPSEVWDSINKSWYADQRFPKYSKSEDGKYLIVFLNLKEDKYDRWWRSFDTDYDVYDEKTNLIYWWGNLKTHSKQPLFQDVINHNLKVHFFSKWNDDKVTEYLGEGKFMKSNDDLSFTTRILMIHQIFS